MKIANNLRRLAVVFVNLFVFSQPLWALDSYKEYRRDHWDLELGTDYFYSESNYPTSGGAAQNLPSGNHYSLLNVNLATRYVPRRDWSIFAWGSVANSESKDSLSVRQNSSLTELAVGADFVMYSNEFQLIPEFIAVAPLAKVDPTSDVVMNHEGVFELRSRLRFQKDFGSVRGYGWVGFDFRGEGRSFLAPWGVGTQLKLSRVRLGAELFGYQSITEDTDRNWSQRTSYINGVNAGSLRFYSIEPSVVDSKVYAMWLMSSRWSLQGQVGTTLSGESMAAGFHVGGFLRYAFDLTEGYREQPYVAPVESQIPASPSNMYQETPLSSERKVRRFEEQLDDGVDQRLFRARPTPKPRVNDVELQKQLDDTEFNVELKAKKKKKKK